MKMIGAFQAKTHFSALIEQVEKGEHITITKHGKAVAKLVPANIPRQESIKEIIDRLKNFRKTHTLGNIDWKQLRDEGRK